MAGRLMPSVKNCLGMPKAYVIVIAGRQNVDTLLRRMAGRLMPSVKNCLGMPKAYVIVIAGRQNVDTLLRHLTRTERRRCRDL